jgi:hypothetical protein
MLFIRDLIDLHFVHFIFKFLSLYSPCTLQHPIDMEQSQFEMYIGKWNVVIIVLEVAKPIFKSILDLMKPKLTKWCQEKLKDTSQTLATIWMLSSEACKTPFTCCNWIFMFIVL